MVGCGHDYDEVNERCVGLTGHRLSSRDVPSASFAGTNFSWNAPSSENVKISTRNKKRQRTLQIHYASGDCPMAGERIIANLERLHSDSKLALIQIQLIFFLQV